MRPMRFALIVLFAAGTALLGPTGLALAGSGCSFPPTDYDEFVVVDNAQALETALSGSEPKCIFLLPGTYGLNNPVDISSSVFLHGGDRRFTALRALNSDEPLFRIRGSAPNHVNFTGFRLWPPKPPGTFVNAVAVEIKTREPILFEMVDMSLMQGQVLINAPGTFRIQGTTVHNNGYTAAPILLDHPDAELIVVGGNINNGANLDPQPGVGPDVYHIWQRYGRLRVYGTGTQVALSDADFRIETAAAQGAHVIANVRSEGTKGSSGLPSALLVVPQTSEAVDVVFKNNGGSFTNSPGFGLSHFVDYNGSGKLWMIGNNSTGGAGALALGNAPQATIIALVNRLAKNTNMLPIVAQRKIFAGNVYSWAQQTGCELPGSCCQPTSRFVNPQVTLQDYQNVPEIPEDEIPMPILRPTLNDKIWPGMVSVTDFGASPAAGNDDTAAMQAAFDYALEPNDLRQKGLVFIPAGTYEILEPLSWVHSDQCDGQEIGDCSIVNPNTTPGSWIAGAGRDATFIKNCAQDTVLQTEGASLLTVQGITFETTGYPRRNPQCQIPVPLLSGDIDVPAVSIENVYGVGLATQEVMFHECRFIGGKHALGIGIETNHNSSENLMIASEFRDAQYGLGIASFNALANIAYDSTFDSNVYAMGHDEDEQPAGGTWAVYHGVVRNTINADLRLRASSSSIHYFFGLDTDSATVFDREGGTGGSFQLLFENTTFTPPSPAQQPLFDYKVGGGMTFLRSSVPPVENSPVKNMRLSGGIGVNFALDLYSDIENWGDVVTGQRNRTYQLLSPSRCYADVHCDDGLACTLDSCDRNVCQFVPQCDDGIPCTVDLCRNTDTGGTCITETHGVSCDDGYDCTEETCNATGCDVKFVDGAQTICCQDCPPRNDCGGGSCQPQLPWECTQTGTGLADCCFDPPCDTEEDVLFCDPGDTVIIENCECDSPMGEPCNTHNQAIFCNCLNDAQCDDGLFCNGVETCGQTGCEAGAPPCSPLDFCDELQDTCVPLCPDRYVCTGDGGCWRRFPPDCTEYDIGIEACRLDDETYTCDPGETIHVQNCECAAALGAICTREDQSWLCR